MEVLYVLGESAKHVGGGGRPEWRKGSGAGKVLMVSDESAADHVMLTALQDVPRHHPASFRRDAHIRHFLLGKFLPFPFIPNPDPDPDSHPDSH
jgi:hypothetical protein